MYSHSHKAFNYSCFLLFPILAGIIIPFLKYRIPALFLTPFAIAWFLCNASRFRCSYRLQLKNIAVKIIVLIIFFYSLDSIYAFFGYGRSFFEHPVVLTEMLFVLFFFSVFHCLCINAELRELRMILFFTLICYFICAGTTLAGLSQFQDGSRYLSGGTGQDALAVRDAMQLGMGGYGYIYAMMLLIAPLIFICFKSTKKIKIILFAIISCLIICVFRAGFSTASAIMLIGIMLALVATVILNYYKLILFLLGTMFLILAWNPSVLSPFAKLFSDAAYAVGNDNYAYRLKSMADAAYDDNQDERGSYATTRMALGKVSWRSFLKKPLFGYGTADILGFREDGERIAPGHSTFFDRLAYFGVVGFVIFFALFYYLRKYMKIVARIYGLRSLFCYDILLFQSLLVSFVTTLVGFQAMINFVSIVPMIMFFDRQVDLVQKKQVR